MSRSPSTCSHPTAHAVAFLPFATSVLAGSLRSGHGERTAVVFYGLAFGATALTFNVIWRYARHHGLLGQTLDPAAATAIGRRFLLALGWLAAGTLLCSPYVYMYDLAVLAIPVAYLVRAGFDDGFRPHEPHALAFVLALVASYPFLQVPVGLAATLVVAALVLARAGAGWLPVSASRRLASAGR